MRETQAPQGESIATEAGKALVNLPLFLIELITSLAVCAISEIYVATFALTGVAVGIASDWKIGLAAFFVLYSVSRVINSVANAIGSAGQNVAITLGQGLVQHGYAIREAAHPTPVPEGEPGIAKIDPTSLV